MSLVDALQRALAIEQQVIYGYGVLGAHLSDPNELGHPAPSPDDARDRLDQHLELRDRIATLVKATGRTPVAGEAAYRLPFAVDSASAARKLGQELEQSAAGAAYDVIAASAPHSPERRVLAAALTAAADWQAQWALADFEPYANPFPGRPGQPAASQPSTTPTSSSS